MTVYENPNERMIDLNCAALSKVLNAQPTPEHRLAIFYAVVAACSSHFSTDNWKKILGWASLPSEIENTFRDPTYIHFRKELSQSGPVITIIEERVVE